MRESASVIPVKQPIGTGRIGREMKRNIKFYRIEVGKDSCSIIGWVSTAKESNVFSSVNS